MWDLMVATVDTVKQSKLLKDRFENVTHFDEFGLGIYFIYALIFNLCFETVHQHCAFFLMNYRILLSIFYDY